ncbi:MULTISPECIES: EFR1 family ferrodoxin [unclassified Clostridioides]|uniref:EFR1 family ferrodoxin n=1 Tax=unclassified Clostridioides TaxID=2635829 RepID=UPI001D0C3534|nr:NAD(P)H-dependent oxidoreductase [Clostridioides sp. ES-S-0001-03]UDN61237.1 NAD(P)H-dependent oxidoreductase [Clostridioides sp. ES-W-0016-02]
MLGIYFSGTGNSKYCIEKFLQEYDMTSKAFSIEDKQLLHQISQHKDIVFSYPTQYSNIPKILKDFIINHQNLWKDKRVFIIATMGLFSGDGAGILARLLKKYGAVTIGGLHLKMPDSIADEKALKKTLESNKKLITNAEQKIKHAVRKIQDGTPPQDGIGIFHHIAGLFGQRLYFINKTKYYSDKLKISADKCIGCGKCVSLCCLKNIVVKNGVAIPGNQCTMCYRCVNNCPKQAITLLGKRVIEQSKIEKYL